MARMTKEERSSRMAERKAEVARMAAVRSEAIAVVQGGCCPQCGVKLRRNLSLAGWWQCSQLGAEGFRADASKPSCSFQCFTE